MATWLEWHTSKPIPTWVSGSRFVVDKQFVSSVKDGTKTQSRRTTLGGYSKTNVWCRQWWKAYDERLWVRLLTGRADITQFGWGLITCMQYERFGNMPADAPALEGMADLPLLSFKQMTFFNGVSENDNLLVFTFQFAPLGPAHDPFPAHPLAVLDPMASTCSVCDRAGSFAHSCTVCNHNVCGIIAGCSTPVPEDHELYDGDNEMAVLCNKCAGGANCVCGEPGVGCDCDICGEKVCGHCALNTPDNMLEEDGGSGLSCKSCVEEATSADKVCACGLMCVSVCM